MFNSWVYDMRAGHYDLFIFYDLLYKVYYLVTGRGYTEVFSLAEMC